VSYVANLEASIAEHQRIIDAGLPEAAQAQEIISQHQAEISRVQGGGDGGGGGGFNDALALQQQQQAWEEKMQQMERQREQRRVIETVQAVFAQYGLGSLNSVIEDYARKDYSPEAIQILLRQTPQYKQRFPAMEALAAKNRAITEAEYIDYERTAASLERQYGLPQSMLTGRVTDLLTNEVSAAEMNDRVVLAASAAIQAPQDFRDTMTSFYGIDTGGLTAYFLDPQVATPLLEKQYASSIIGTEARRQGVGIDVYGAENLQELGISQDQARVGFGQVARARPLTEGRGDIVNQQQLIQGTFGASEEAQRAVERAQSARVGRFQQGGGAITTQQGVAGAGTAATR
jgi:hypothetical protein